MARRLRLEFWRELKAEGKTGEKVQPVTGELLWVGGLGLEQDRGCEAHVREGLWTEGQKEDLV